MHRGFSWIAVAAGLVLFAGAGVSSAADPKYVGVAKCRSCHKKELMGNQYGEWQKGEHAKAFETLKGEKAAEIAKKKGIAGPAHAAAECLECHVTAYGKPASAFAKKALKETDGVQCESCHGPGSDYKKKKTMSDHAKAVAKGLWEPEKDQKICTTCHNDKSPTWDAAKGFDFEAAKKKIAHPIPEDVKGKYLEVVKQRGAAEDDEEDEDE